MDNLAHALVGAAVGRAVGGGRMPWPGLVGAVAANAPDVAEVFFGLFDWNRGQYLALHRGITHSIAGAAIETVVLALVVGLVYLAASRRSDVAGPRWGLVSALVAAAVASHLFMDWQGSYGLRPFLPWNGRWYYGDFVAIVDPWFWIVPLVAIAWGGRRYWLPLGWYGVIWAATTAAVFLSGRASASIRIDWLLLSVVGAAGWVPHWFAPRRARRVARFGLLVLVVHIGALAVLGLPAKARLAREARDRFGPDATWAALTVVGRSLGSDKMMAGPDTVAGPGWAIPRHLDQPEVQWAIRETADGRAIAVFARFLVADLDSSQSPHRVLLRDARYTRFGGNGWAAVTVSVPSP